MTTDELLALVERIECGEWRASAHRDRLSRNVFVKLEWTNRPNICDPDGPVVTIEAKSCIPEDDLEYLTEEVFVMRLRDQLYGLARHEIDEWLTVRGQKVAEPRHA